MKPTRKDLKPITLYAVSATGKCLDWNVWTEGSTVHTQWGELGGTQQRSSFKCVPKNVGKKNATTAEQQAVKEAIALADSKRTKKYFDSIEKATKKSLIRPMLAKTFADHGKKIAYEKQTYRGYRIRTYVQPKLDGFRCLAYYNDFGRLVLMSRGGKELDVPHIAAFVESMISPEDKYVLDGELYCHGESLQTISSWVKRKQENTKKLKFHVYDCPLLPEDPKKLDPAPFMQRYSRFIEAYVLMQPTGSKDHPVQSVDTVFARDPREIEKWYDFFTKAGFEGAIIRHGHSPYKWAGRSDSLLKYKKSIRHEFPIVSYRTGKGKFSKVPIYTCRSKNGALFEAAIKGTMKEREKMLNKAESHVGELLTVEFFAYTPAGVPQFPVGIAVRYQDDL